MYVPFRSRAAASTRSSTSIAVQVMSPAEVTPLIVLQPAVSVSAYPIATPTATTTTTSSTGNADTEIVMDGDWDDHYCDCCDYGCCHPSFCMALFFPRLLLGQIMTRLQLNVCGNTTRERTAKKTCGTIFVIVFLFFLWSFLRLKFAFNDDEYPYGDVLDVIFTIFN
jgi:hypothetical protein